MLRVIAAHHQRITAAAAAGGDFYSVKDQWVSFDPQLHHCVESVTSGDRRSLALFTPKSSKRIPSHSLEELMEIGFFLPFITPVAEAETTALPVEGSHISSPSLADRLKDDELALKAFGPLPAQAMYLKELPESQKEDIILWCASELVSLPHKDLPCSDGSIDPLTQDEMKDLEAHVRSGHVTKSNNCRWCLEAEGPRKIHRGVKDVDKATHTLHIDIAGPLPDSDDNYSYFMVGPLRLPGLPLLIDVRLLATRTSVEVCDKLEKMVAYLESLQTEGLPIGETRRIKINERHVPSTDPLCSYVDATIDPLPSSQWSLQEK